MKIIEFLLDNIFIVVVIFGALASIFGKSGAKKKPGQMPDFGGGGLPRSLFPQAGDKEREEELPQTQQTTGHTVYRSTSNQEHSDETNRSYSSGEAPGQAQITSLQRALHQAANRKESTQVAAESHYGSQGAMKTRVHADDLRKAVIWAEILGPPRSKRPFRK